MSAAAISQAGLALIQDYEGFRAEPAQLPDGAWLVGHGHARAEAGAPVSAVEAVNLLSADLAPFAGLVSAKVGPPLTQSQFDALVSFAFSIGAEAFAQSQVLRRVNAGEFVAAACAMDAWRKSDAAGEPDVFEALIARRAAEKAMFLQDLPQKAAPSALLRAQLDYAASILGAPVRFARAPEIASPLVVATNLDQIAPAAESSPALEPLLLTQVVAHEVVSDVVNDVVNADVVNADVAAANAAANDAPPARPITFVELPIDRRIRDGRKGGLANGLKSLWGVMRAPTVERA